MKLELGFIRIADIRFAKECRVEDGVLYVDPEALRANLYEDDDIRACVKAIDFDIAKPGETFGLAVQVANPSGKALSGAELRVRALNGWTVKCVSPLGGFNTCSFMTPCHVLPVNVVVPSLVEVFLPRTMPPYSVSSA